MPYIYACLNQTPDWWDRHTVVLEDGHEVARIYGRNPTSVRLRDGKILLDVAHRPSLTCQISRHPPTEAEWEKYRVFALHYYRNTRYSMIVTCSDWDRPDGRVLNKVNGTWETLPATVDLFGTLFVSFDDLDAKR